MHEILVVKVTCVHPHFNADSLDLIQVEGFDYQIISRRNQFQVGDLGIYIEPDYVVSTNVKEFAFLGEPNKNIRITNRRLRGLWSDELRKPDTLLRLAQGRAQARGLVTVDGKGVGIWKPVRGTGGASTYSSG